MHDLQPLNGGPQGLLRTGTLPHTTLTMAERYLNRECQGVARLPRAHAALISHEANYARDGDIPAVAVAAALIIAIRRRAAKTVL
jgi:hypothetical protein